MYLELYEEGEVEHINGPTLPPTVMHEFKLLKDQGGIDCGFLLY